MQRNLTLALWGGRSVSGGAAAKEVHLQLLQPLRVLCDQAQLRSARRTKTEILMEQGICCLCEGMTRGPERRCMRAVLCCAVREQLASCKRSSCTSWRGFCAQVQVAGCQHSAVRGGYELSAQ